MALIEWRDEHRNANDSVDFGHQALIDEIGDITGEVVRPGKLSKPTFEKNIAQWFQLHFKTRDSRLSGRHEHESASRPSRKT